MLLQGTYGKGLGFFLKSFASCKYVIMMKTVFFLAITHYSHFLQSYRVCIILKPISSLWLLEITCLYSHSE